MEITAFSTRDNFGNTIYTFPVLAMGKPRMTRSDRWKKRDVTDRYWTYKDNLNFCANKIAFNPQEVFASYYHLIFYLPMPDSWSEKKKQQMDETFHRSKPDKDNLEKGFLDCLCKDDSFIADSRVTKYWCRKGLERIVLIA